MKINKALVLLLFVGLIFEILIANIFYMQTFEFQFVLDIIFVFYMANKNLFLEEENYKDQKYLLNINNLYILVVMYIERIYSSSLYFVNVIFIFLIPYIVINKYFPNKIKSSFFSILIVYMSLFFLIKDCFFIVFVSNYQIYINLILMSKIFINIFVNILIIIMLKLVFYKMLKVEKKS